MASGYGLNGGRSRCFEHWQEFQKCYARAETKGECTLQKEDYLECLHRTKEIARAKEIKAHYLQKQAHESKNQREYAEKAATGIVVGLGLVEKEPGK
ncbi:hypothetical protein DB88DRAFT_500629 [Papiliotrema laurentii]|uniref:NADH dehydrogenase [ubiquinone] iron-sulfur protein 5 n=1 Tax=Papiliotrema laurentii TaxID=5418 RepID=A0AAD9FJB9_PAPLA|nr:hypothetical protein DB88DRAFT_500629 [Papiliotrema laurentii]